MDEFAKILVVHTRNKSKKNFPVKNLPRVKNVLFLFANNLEEGEKLFAANRDVRLVVVKVTRAINKAARLVGYIRANSQVPIIGIVLHYPHIKPLMSAGCADCVYDAENTINPIYFSMKHLQGK